MDKDSRGEEIEQCGGIGFSEPMIVPLLILIIVYNILKCL